GVFLFILSGSYFATHGQPAPQASRTQAPPALLQAQSALAHGDPEEAIRILSTHLQASPKDSSARLMLGQAYALSGQNDLAETELQKVIKSAPENYVALAALGEIYEQGGRLDKAEGMLARASRASHGEPEIRLEWAIALARLHRYKEAQTALVDLAPPKDVEKRIAFYRLKASVASGLGSSVAAATEMEKALALKPGDSALTLATAAAELQRKDWQRAASLAGGLFSKTRDPSAGLILLEATLGSRGDFRQILEQFRNIGLPKTEEVAFRQRVAQLLIAHGQVSESVDELKRAAELDPGRADMLFNLALAQLKAGQADAALDSAEKSKSLGDSAEVEDLLGDIQEERGDNLAAVQRYQAAVKLAPEEEKYRISLAVELMQHQGFDAAKVVLQQAEMFQPKSWRIQLALGMIEHFTGSDEKAAPILVHAADLSPDPEVALRFLGEIQVGQSAAPDPAALEHICEYSNRHFKNGKMQFYCGALLFQRDYVAGDRTHVDEIAKRLRGAARILADDPSPHCELAKVYWSMDHWQEALPDAETCARLDPNAAEAHYRLAQIYRRLGNSEKAQQQMKLYETASQQQADENKRRDETMKAFVYTIRAETPAPK
ncbi:MAG TPA: tetratricopeptide repeat protein, partial [Candidatus Acidoferrum sp.]|nr:tetratricopeptide repeat protein [Candidatus Acidoferrum sp.]